MAKKFFFGLVGIVAAIACGSSADNGDDDDSSDGGSKNSSTTKATTNTGYSATNTNTVNNTGNNANGGGNSTTNSVNNFGSTTGNTQTTTTVRPAGGGTTSASSTSTSLQINPNRQISVAEEQSIRESGCNAWAFEPEIYPVKLEVVVDISSSMNDTAPGSNQSKWIITRDALIEAIAGNGTSGGLPGTTAVGLLFYPVIKLGSDVDVPSTAQPDSSLCIRPEGETPMAPLGGYDANSQRTLLGQTIAGVNLGQGTPTADAFRYALDHSVLSDAQKAIEGESYMLLITDGMPTMFKGCYNPQATLTELGTPAGDEVVSEVDYAYNQGVKTFIVGAPGSEGGTNKVNTDMRPSLSKAAYMGGTAAGYCNPNSTSPPFCHMDMTQAADFSVALRNGLNAVMSQISGCKFEIPATSADGAMTTDPNKVAPLIQFSNGRHMLIGRATPDSASCVDGFRIINNGAMLELCKNTCNELLADSLATVQFIFGCSSEDIADDLSI